MNTWGEKFKLSIFGESHGAAIGIVIDGLKPGLELDMDFIKSEMARRAPGNSEVSTPRVEDDEVEILSGVFEGKSAGTPISAIIRNKNTRSKDYNKTLLRPGHADFTGFVKYKGFADYRGGGHFSGRLTAPLVFAGAIAKLALTQEGITVAARKLAVGGVHGDEDAMRITVMQAKEHGDSVGGIIECVVSNVPAGLGEPFFGSVESVISSIIFSIPAVKGIEFGRGFKLANMLGSRANDEFFMDGDTVKTRTNHNGGINGGITNGMPIVFRAAIKPTPSISIKQHTVNAETMKDAEIEINGRHDPCIVYRAVPVIEAATAVCLLDLCYRI